METLFGDLSKGWGAPGAKPGTRRQLGDEAESRVCELLESKGYRIIDRNAAYRFGEIDVIAEHQGVVCFVEVRMRATGGFGSPAATVSFAKQRKVVRAAMLYLQRERVLGKVAVRFDVVAVVGRGAKAVLEHIPNAFDAGC